MSVPLDRLYNFLRGIINLDDDLLIYRFFPHGSRKLQDLTIMHDFPTLDWVKRMTTPCLIFHDQEPLNYNLYSEAEFRDLVDSKPVYHPSDNPKKLIASLHLRACVNMPLAVYDQTLLCHSEQHSTELERYKQHGFIGVYYWSHALIARDWYRFARVDPGLAVNFNNINSDFLIYNRAWAGTREYRLTLAELLADNNLLSFCNITFSEVDDQVHYTDHVFANPALAISRCDLHQFYLANTHDSNASADYNSNDYATSAIEVVLETLFDDSRHHLTEKALRPIACGRPFMLAATPGSLQYLRQYGFETFGDLIDETYDTIQDPKERLQAITQEMKRISCLAPNKKRALWSGLYAIAKRNRELFFSEAWHDRIVAEFKDNFAAGFEQLTATGKYQAELDRIALTDTALALFRASDSPFGEPSLQSREQLKRWIQERNSVKLNS